MSARARADVARLASGVGVVVAGGVAAAGGVGGWEAALFHAGNGLQLGAARPAILVVMQAGALGAVAVAAAVAVWARRRRLALVLAGGGVAAWLAAKVAKAVVGRLRPPALLDDVVVRTNEAAGIGYPSGHVAVATTLYVLAAPHLPRRWRAAGWAVVAVVAFGRLYVGAHLPLDLLGGLGLGYAVGAAARLLEGLPRWRRQRQPAARE